MVSNDIDEVSSAAAAAAAVWGNGNMKLSAAQTPRNSGIK